jgi:5-(carboxyamino)imidazole ribonucleotide synthase
VSAQKRIGILGGGQLARMMALAAYPLNIATRVYEPAEESCAAQVTERIVGEYDDYRSLFQFIQGCDVVTYEFENVTLETARWIAERVPVYPPPDALRVSQDRIVEKTFLRELGIAVPLFQAIDTEADFRLAIQIIGLPAVLKTTRFGYDGKGQAVIRDAKEAEKAWELLGGRPLILEQFMPFERELSLITVAGGNSMQSYCLIENTHRAGMLRHSIARPELNNTSIHQAALAAARAVIDQLHYIGVLTIEFFEVQGKLYANEMAPRVHNSGHWTIEGADCSQFENHIRAVAGFPLGSTRTRGYAQMLNAIGVIPSVEDLADEAGFAHLHHYGKATKAQRKLGHVSICGEDASAVQALTAKLKVRVDPPGQL